jgi:hypothetical protein
MSTKRMGMGPKNAEVFIEDGVPYMRMYLEKQACYVTYALLMDWLPDLERELLEVELYPGYRPIQSASKVEGLASTDNILTPDGPSRGTGGK